ncbi:MAG: type II toxin-antitoxin system VapC family toxin [Longimicrobiales bacterium]|nr:type II toxin-antitoxin system VapC family toxin [Longimicrobiales bacterium]
MSRFMFDTDTCSYLMKGASKVLDERVGQVAVGDVCMSVITRAELGCGVAISPRPEQDRKALEALVAYVQVLELPEEAADHYAAIRADLTRRGEMIGANDLLIAAHARCLDLVLVTNNTREFERVQGLALKSWLAE